MSDFDLHEGVGAYYVRVSDDVQDIKRQVEGIQRWLNRHGVVVPEQFRFMDEGFVRDLPLLRPEFQKMMKAVDAGQIRWIVADRQDRFGSKDKYQFISFMHRLREGMCRFFTVDDKCWNDDSMMSFMEGGFGAETSEKEQKEKGWRVLGAQIEKARRGEWSGGHIAYGMDVACYDKLNQEKWRVIIEGRDLTGSKPGKSGTRRRVYSTRRLKVFPDGKTERFDGIRNFPASEKDDTLRQTPSKDKTKLAVIREVFTKFATEDISPTQIATFLNSVGVPHHYSDRWKHFHVREMLKNPIYSGYQRWNSNGQGRFYEFLDGEPRAVDDANGRRERLKSDWVLSDNRLFDPLISDEIWAAVEARFDENLRPTRSPKSADLWLSGLLYCAHCHQPMRGMKRPTRTEYFCSTYAEKKDKCGCLRHCVNHKLIEAEIRRYLEESGKEASDILEAQQTGNMELLKPYKDKHLHNMIRCGEAMTKMIQRIVKHDDWEQILRRCGAKQETKKPPETLDEFHEDWRQLWLPVQRAYEIFFQKDQKETEDRLRELDAEHTQLTERVLNLDATTGKRAIEKANARIAELEDQMMSVEANLTNWSGRYQEIREEMFAHVYALRAATEALDDPDADNRRKARDIRSCIQKVNLTFKPTGKKYPTSELVEIEIIPAEPEYPNGASHCRAITLLKCHSSEQSLRLLE